MPFSLVSNARSIEISLEKKRLGFTIGALVLVAEVVVENKILDPLLFFLLGLLLRAHGDSEAGVGGQIDLTSLITLAMQSCEDQQRRNLPAACFHAC